MGLIEPQEWSYPYVDEIEGLIQWARDHHREHIEFEARRVQELAEFDHYKYMVSAHLSTTQTNLVNGTWTKVELDTADLNHGSCLNATTHQFTVPVSRRWCISASIYFTNCVTDKWYGGRIRKVDTVDLAYDHFYVPGSGNAIVTMARMVELDEGDVLELQAVSNSGDNTVDIYGSDVIIGTFFTAYVVG